jgi:hypothetical protein
MAVNVYTVLFFYTVCGLGENRYCSIKRLWKEAQREVRQHKFINEYIAAYIQVLYEYKSDAVHPPGLTTEYTECWPCPLFDILFNKYNPAG